MDHLLLHSKSAIMLDHVCIFSRTGVVLWSHAYVSFKGQGPHGPVDAVIKSVLLEGKGAAGRHSTDAHAVRWTMDNNLGLVFAVVFQRMLNLSYVESLLESVKSDFLRRYGRFVPHSEQALKRQLFLSPPSANSQCNFKSPLLTLHAFTQKIEPRSRPQHVQGLRQVL